MGTLQGLESIEVRKNEEEAKKMTMTSRQGPLLFWSGVDEVVENKKDRNLFPTMEKWQKHRDGSLVRRQVRPKPPPEPPDPDSPWEEDGSVAVNNCMILWPPTGLSPPDPGSPTAHISKRPPPEPPDLEATSTIAAEKRSKRPEPNAPPLPPKPPDPISPMGTERKGAAVQLGFACPLTQLPPPNPPDPAVAETRAERVGMITAEIQARRVAAQHSLTNSCTAKNKGGEASGSSFQQPGQNFDLLGQAQILLVSIWHIAVEVYFPEGTNQAQICEVRIAELNVAVEKIWGLIFTEGSGMTNWVKRTYEKGDKGVKWELTLDFSSVLPDVLQRGKSNSPLYDSISNGKKKCWCEEFYYEVSEAAKRLHLEEFLVSDGLGNRFKLTTPVEGKGSVGDVVRHYLLRAQVTEDVNEVFVVVFASEKDET